MSKADELAKLDALRQSGVLSQEEFDAEKAKLLAGILPALASNSPQPSGAEDPVVSAAAAGGATVSTDPSIAAANPLADPIVSVPDLFPLPSPFFYVFAQDGKLYFGWEQPGFYIKAGSRTRHSFPLTEDGWKSAWETMSSDYPKLAAKVASAVERRKQEEADSQRLERLRTLAVASPDIQPVMPVERQPPTGAISPGAATTIGAGALLALGSLLPWATASTPFGSISKDGTSGDGVITLILAAIAILCGVLSLHGEKGKSGWAGLGAVAFLLAGAVSIYDMSSLPIPSTNLVIVSVGIGLWLCTIGAIVGLIAACFATYATSKVPVVTGDSLGTSATTYGPPPEVRVATPPPASVTVPPLSVADELTKLAKLKADGVLSEAEFAAQKEQLLS
jgi:hypothetical protein